MHVNVTMSYTCNVHDVMSRNVLYMQSTWSYDILTCVQTMLVSYVIIVYIVYVC